MINTPYFICLICTKTNVLNFYNLVDVSINLNLNLDGAFFNLTQYADICVYEQ